MSNWHRFIPADFEYNFEEDHLFIVLLSMNNVSFFKLKTRRNKSYRDRYQLIGRTRGGRRLKIIFQLKPRKIVRIITGWTV